MTKNKALEGFKPLSACLLDRHFNQLSGGASDSNVFLPENPSSFKSLIELLMWLLSHLEKGTNLKYQILGGAVA